MESSLIRNMTERLPSEAPTFQLIVDNEYKALSGASTPMPVTASRSPFLEEVFPCECRYSEDSKNPEAQACGELSDCINRTLSIECNAEDCPCRDNCQNQRFQKHQFADVEVFETPGKGFGLRTRQDIYPGQFISEYVGEVLNQTRFEERTESYSKQGQRHFYFMTLQNDQVIDATKKGNLSRFMNHSCNPNCATQKWIVRGRLRIGLFALRRVRAGTELTFDYKYIRFGATAQKCLCGEAGCNGFIGEELKESRVATNRPTTSQEEDDAILALERFKGDSGITEPSDMELLARMLLRTEDINSIKILLSTLVKTTNPALLRRFISLHGLQIINIVFGSHWRDISIIATCIDILQHLPVANRNQIEDAHIEDKLHRLIGRGDLGGDHGWKCGEILRNWSSLSRIFRIPKAHNACNDYLSLEGRQKPQYPQVGPLAPGYDLGERLDRSKKSHWNYSASKRPDTPDQGYNYGRDQTVELLPGWHSTRTPEGRLYYYHETTRETRWDPPNQNQTLLANPSRASNFQSVPSKRSESEPKRSIPPVNKLPLPQMANTEDQDRRLQEIINRAKKAAMERSNKKSPVDLTKDIRDKVDEGSTSDDAGERKDASWRSYETALREEVSRLVVRYLSRWCRNQMDGSAFKEYARKLTHGIVEKEMRSFKNFDRPAPDLQQALPSRAKRQKIKLYLSKYLSDHGYRVDAEDGETPADSGNANSLR